MAGTVAGWQLARDSWAARNPSETLTPLDELLAPAVDKANRGITVTDSLAAASAKVSTELRESAGYQQVFTRSGAELKAGESFLNPGLGELLHELGEQLRCGSSHILVVLLRDAHRASHNLFHLGC